MVILLFPPSVLLIGLFLLLPTSARADAILFSASGPNASAIQGNVDDFRATIGGVDNGNAPGPLATGRREINWDGGGAMAPVNTNMPKDLFLNNRGALFGPDTTVFSISGAPDARFGNINPTYPTIFSTFSDPRLFAPTNSIVTDVSFFIPGSGTTTPAFLTAFGAVFTNVNLANTTSIQYFGAGGASLGTFFAPISNVGGLSFLGVQFNAGEQILGARLTTGNTILGPNNGGLINVVAMDNFIYSEPKAVAVPETSASILILLGLVGLEFCRRICFQGTTDSKLTA
jgi:hypothetical protein